MINRRNFLKYTGLAALAVGTGFNARRILNRTENNKLFVYAFLPEDNKYLRDIVKAFESKIDTGFITIINYDRSLQNLAGIVSSSLEKKSILSNDIVKVRLNKIGEKIKSDLLFGTADKYIISPAAELDKNITELKNRLNGKDASIFLTLEYQENNFLSSFIKGNDKELIIENENGIAEKIKTDKNYKHIELDGIQGKTVIEIKERLVKIKQSSCRHRLCEKRGYISQPGEVIVCAPNKMLIRIENT